MDWDDVVKSIRMKPYVDKLWGMNPVMFLLEGPWGFCPSSLNLFQELHGQQNSREKDALGKGPFLSPPWAGLGRTVVVSWAR